MRTTLDPNEIKSLLSLLPTSSDSPAGGRQPVQVLYGGAHLFSPATPQKLAGIARAVLADNIADAGSFSDVFGLDASLGEMVLAGVREKLSAEPIEDLRIDFEDGYGSRSGAEEDGHAEAAASATAEAMAAGGLPPFMGIRPKAMNRNSGERAIRTLDIFISTLLSAAGSLPDNFVVTLPKVTSTDEVAQFCKALSMIEKANGSPSQIPIELMIETPLALFDPDGRSALRPLIDAADGRCRGLHFGAYDHLSLLGIAANAQRLDHPACDLARGLMQLNSPADIWLSDGATNVMPIGVHRGTSLTDTQREENRGLILQGLRTHFDNCLRSMAHGFYQGWDLHPGQLVARYAAVQTFFLSNLGETAARLRNFIERAAQASLVGGVFDDEATGQGLLNFFLRAINARVLAPERVKELTTLTSQELSSRSFAKIVAGRTST